MTDRQQVTVIAIDGPGGSGKGTVSSLVARELGWHMLDSGALYRLVALATVEQGVDIDDRAGLGEFCQGLDIAFQPSDSGTTEACLDGRVVSHLLRSEQISARASQVAAIDVVRQALYDLQRAFKKAPGLVADGRDMGTVIFPEAELKIYLTASAEERARRRYNQLKEKGESVTFASLLQDILRRDDRDMNRAVAPLKPAADSVVIDSTGLTIEQVVNQVLKLVMERGLA